MHQRITHGHAVRSITATITSGETSLDNAVIDTTLDSYLVQLDDVDRLCKEVGQELQERFRGANGNQDETGRANQDGQEPSSTQSTLRSHPASLCSRGPTPEEEEGSRSPTHEPDADGHRDKRQCPDPSQFPWNAPEYSADKLLQPELRHTLRRLKNYAKDVKFSKSDLINSAGAPEFPNSEWTNILHGHAVDLDCVFSSLYVLSPSDKQVEHVGDLELRYNAASPSKTVQSARDWVIAWQRTVLATTYAFPD